MLGHPVDRAEKFWEVNGRKHVLRISHVPGFGSHFCGYVGFKKRPVKEKSYHGILKSVPVHGWITYAQYEDGYYWYGFDIGGDVSLVQPKRRH